MDKISIIIDKIERILAKNDTVIIAIDGPCTSGKSTLAAELNTRLGGNLFHIDDFFLQSCQRTEERLLEIGGNFDYERFTAEVIEPLKKRETVLYRPYICYKGEFGREIPMRCERVNIIEGSYSTHPRLGDYADLKIFVTVSSQEQYERLEKRNPLLIDRFVNQWIPKENAYFEMFSIKDRADITVEMREK